MTKKIDTTHCKKSTLDFIYLKGDAQQEAITKQIVADLLKVGITAKPKPLEKEALNAAMKEGNFNLCMSETWGNPYDPHSYLSSWKVANEAHHTVLANLPEPLDDKTFATRIDDILSTSKEENREKKYTSLLDDIHKSNIHIPLYGKRMPSVVSKRLIGYVPGFQQFDYPMQNIQVVKGSQTVKVAPGAQTGLFKTVGRLDPHSYRPNEFFANNWVYEGLVSYGANGAMKPALASSWKISVDDKDVETVEFTLRQNVKFHDNAAWNCTVAKLNFDHVLAPPLRSGDWHGWYSLPNAIASTRCDSTYKFVVVANKPYYPLLQELSYIRPLRMLSPNAFVDGITTSPVTKNSCPTGWKSPKCYQGAVASCVDIICAGTTGIVGTGPFKFDKRTKSTKKNDDGSYNDDTVDFLKNTDYWGGAPSIDIQIVRYDTADEVETALKDGSLDAVIGAGVIKPAALRRFHYNSDFEVRHTEAIMNTAVILKIDNIQLRKTIIHSVNKGTIIKEQLSGMEQPVSQLFQTSAPYCSLDLVPKFDYDIEKAGLLNCNAPNEPSSVFLGIFIGVVVLAWSAIAITCFLVRREKSGDPFFTPLNGVEVKPKSNEKYKDTEMAITKN